MELDSNTKKNTAESNKNHSSLKPSQACFPHLGEKLEFLYAQLGVTQQYLASQLGVTSGAISQWKGNGVPKAKISGLCRCLGIGRAELELPELKAFYTAVQKRYGQATGTYWRLHAQQHSVTGLEIDVVAHAAATRPKLKAIYRQPQAVTALKHLPRVKLNDTIQFKLPIARSELPHHQPLQTLLLIVEDPSGIQLLTPEPQAPQQLFNHEYYALPGDGKAPFYVGLPTGKYCAYLVLLAANPPQALWQTFAEKPDGYAADCLVQWLRKEKVTHKINALEFQVNA